MPLYRRPGSPFWWVRIGRKTRRSTGTTDRAKAKEFEAVLQERLWRRDKLGDRGSISWAEAADRWLSDSARPRKRDREILEWLKPSIGEYPVSAVADPDAIEELRKDALAEGWAHSTADRAMRTVRAVLRKCVTWRYIETAPAVPMYGEPEPEPRFLTQAQFEKLRKELPEHLSLAARFAVHTLLRMRAQSSLTWDRVDLRGKRAWVPSGNMKAGKTFGFPLSTESLKILRRLKTLNPKGERVFQWNGKPIDNFHTAAFKKAVARAKVGPFRWHDLRHTGASWAVQNGVTLPELMALGDWKSYRMVLRYSHLAPQNSINAAEKIGAKLRGKIKARAGKERG